MHRTSDDKLQYSSDHTGFPPIIGGPGVMEFIIKGRQSYAEKKSPYETKFYIPYYRIIIKTI